MARIDAQHKPFETEAGVGPSRSNTKFLSVLVNRNAGGAGLLTFRYARPSINT
jgi:hypothetical protein